MNLVVVTLLSLGVQQEGDAVAKLIERLKSDSIADREDAANALRSMGSRAAPALSKASAGRDVELAARAKALLRVMEVDGRLTAGLKKAMPELADRLATGEPHAWTEAFIASLDTKRHPTLSFADRDCLAGPALAAARDDAETVRLCQAIAGHEFRSAIPELVRCWRTSHGSAEWDPRAAAAAALFEMEAVEAVADLRALLRTATARERWGIIDLLGALGSRDAVPDLVALLESKDDVPVGTILRALQRLKAPEAAPAAKRLLPSGSRRQAAETLAATAPAEILAVVPLLKDDNPEVRETAARLLGECGAKGAIESLIAVLKDKEQDVRIAALRALGELEARDRINDVLPMLQDPCGRVCLAAGSALAVWRARDAVPHVIGLLRHRSPEIRWGAVLTLRELNAKEAIDDIARLLQDDNAACRSAACGVLADLAAVRKAPQLAAMLQDKDEDVRATAAGALRTLEARDQVHALKQALKDDSVNVRYRAATSLVLLGERDHLPIATQAGHPTWLNALRRPAEWKRLRQLRLEWSGRETLRQLLERIAKHADLTLELPSPLRKKHDAWLCGPGHVWRGVGGVSGLEALKGNVAFTAATFTGDVAFSGMTFILEEGRIRIVSSDEADIFWRAWIEEQNRAPRTPERDD